MTIATGWTVASSRNTARRLPNTATAATRYSLATHSCPFWHQGFLCKGARVSQYVYIVTPRRVSFSQLTAAIQVNFSVDYHLLHLLPRLTFLHVSTCICPDSSWPRPLPSVPRTRRRADRNVVSIPKCGLTSLILPSAQTITGIERIQRATASNLRQTLPWVMACWLWRASKKRQVAKPTERASTYRHYAFYLLCIFSTLAFVSAFAFHLLSAIASP